MAANKTLKTYLTQVSYLNGIRFNDNNDDEFMTELKESMKNWNKSQHVYALTNTIEFAEENPESLLDGYTVKQAYLSGDTAIIRFTDDSVLSICIEQECCFE